MSSREDNVEVGCECEQGAGSIGEANGGDRRELLAATGMNHACHAYDAGFRNVAVTGQSGGDQLRMSPAADCEHSSMIVDLWRRCLYELPGNARTGDILRWDSRC